MTQKGKPQGGQAGERGRQGVKKLQSQSNTFRQISLFFRATIKAIIIFLACRYLITEALADRLCGRLRDEQRYIEGGAGHDRQRF